nr:hypothetical protein [bacterium]
MGSSSMAWQEILKASNFLEKLEPKQKKKLKKLLQKTQPSEFMGQEMTKLEEVIKEIELLEVVKSDKILTKKVESFREKNLDILASAAELRKDYDNLYRQMREMVYPKKKGDLE